VNARDDQRLERFESVHAMKLRSVICSPIRAWGTIVGVIYLDNRFRPGAFTEEHLELLEGYGSQAGIALDTARMLQREREQNQELARVKAEVEALSQRLQLALEEQALDLEKARRMVTAQRRELSKSAAFAGIIGRSRAIERVLELVHKTADSEIPVYIFGESGTGKELVARAIHRASPRREAPLVTLNCGGLSPQLLASELFGHVRGAFTGATRDHPGLVRMADGGTLFLDEVSEMSPELQVQLLRVLQTGDFRPVGGDEELSADVRVVSASNLDLERCVARGTFREDLFYRLNVLRIDLPPLRERREDIPLLIQHFLEERPIQRAAVALLLEYPWPGNVRELQNELDRAKALGGDKITVQDLSPKIAGATPRSQASDPGGSLGNRVASFEREAIAEALELTGGNLSKAARELGLSRGGLYKKMAAYGLARPRRTRTSKT
jgi:transcriptional regulator with PAS, ATPase and Fis domain